MTHAAAIEGAARAASHAESDSIGWNDKAQQCLRIFAKVKKGAPFMAEDVRIWSEQGGLISAPPDGRAWGHVILRAKREGLLVHAGYAPNKDPKCHGSPKSLWRWAH